VADSVATLIQKANRGDSFVAHFYCLAFLQRLFATLSTNSGHAVAVRTAWGRSRCEGPPEHPKSRGKPEAGSTCCGARNPPKHAPFVMGEYVQNRQSKELDHKKH
jgi:hypothetical protein